MEYIARSSIQRRRNSPCTIHRWRCRATRAWISDWIKRSMKSRADHVCFGLHSKQSNSGLMKFQFCSRAGKSYWGKSQRTYLRSERPPHTKSKSFCCLSTTKHSHSLRIDHIMFFSLCIPLPLILHFSSPQYIFVHLTPLKINSNHSSPSK